MKVIGEMIMRNVKTMLTALALIVAMALSLQSCGGGASSSGSTVDPDAPTGASAELAALREAHVAEWSRLEREWSLAWWNAALSGERSDFEEAESAELAVRRLHSNTETFATLRRLRDSGEITDPAERRSLDILYLAFLENQIDDASMRRMVELQSSLEQTFNTYRPEVNGERITANRIRQTLSQSDDSELRRTMWEASKEVGARIAPQLVELAHVRNDAARRLGYENYYEMMLVMREQDPDDIRRIFDELADMTDGPFLAMKADLDARLAERFGLGSVEELRPWHYADPFFQESPGVGLDLDPFFAARDPREVATQFFNSIGLPVVQEILERSDLYEREGKVEHAFCTHIDRSGDVRILTNLQNDARWMGTLLHELGHGVYDAHIDRSLPFEQRSPAHIFATEGVAELFGNLTRNPSWLRAHGTIPEGAEENLDELVRADRRLDLIVFARWTLVMLGFEREFYANPDQDLNQLWWSLVTRYQGLTPPENVSGRFDFATKIHLVVAPVYYHNYMLGRMYAAQLSHRLSQVAPESLAHGQVDMTGHPEIGQFLIENVFQPGALYPWQEFVRRSTGEDLSAQYFAEEIRAPEAAAGATDATNAPNGG